MHDDLVLTSETIMEGLLLKLKTWRKAMESEGVSQSECCQQHKSDDQCLQCWKAPREGKVPLLSVWKGSKEQFHIL